MWTHILAITIFSLTCLAKAVPPAPPQAPKTSLNLTELVTCTPPSIRVTVISPGSSGKNTTTEISVPLFTDCTYQESTPVTPGRKPIISMCGRQRTNKYQKIQHHRLLSARVRTTANTSTPTATLWTKTVSTHFSGSLGIPLTSKSSWSRQHARLQIQAIMLTQSNPITRR